MNKRIAIAILSTVVAGAAVAQVHGIPAGATSLGGHHTFSNPPGIPAGATSLGPHGFSNGHQGRIFPPQVFSNNLRHDGRVHRVIIPVAIPLYSYAYYPYSY